MIARTSFAYIAIAGICLALHNAVLILSDHAGLALWLAVLLSFGIVATVGYVLHTIFTFHSQPGVKAFGRYVIAMSANIPLAFVATWFWHDKAGLPMTLAAPIASICMLALNFVLGRWAIVPKTRQAPAT